MDHSHGLESVAIIRANRGRLAVAALAVTSADADQIGDDVLTAADATGEDVLVLRADGDRILHVRAPVLPGEGDRIVAAAHARRAV